MPHDVPHGTEARAVDVAERAQQGGGGGGGGGGRNRLGSEGYSVETASDGEAGLARASHGGYDLIVLDVMLPRMNGFDVCREVRQRG